MLPLEVGLESVIGVKVVWRVEDVLKSEGEEYSCECEATIMKRRDASVSE